MSLYQLRLNPTDNRSIKTLQKCSDIDFIVVPAFMDIEKLRRVVAKYAPTEILSDGELLNRIVYAHSKSIDGVNIKNIEKAAYKKRYAVYFDFYLITKPEGIDLHSFAAWVNSLKI